MSKTNLDRLHELALTPRYRLVGARRLGRTTYACHHCADLLQTTEAATTIVWTIPYMHWLAHIRSMLSRILEEHGIPYEWRRDQLCALDKHVLFVTPDRAERRLAGLHPLYQVDDLGECNDFYRG